LENESTPIKENNIQESLSKGLIPYVEKLSFAEKISMRLISRYGKPNTSNYIASAGTGTAFILMAAWLQSEILFYTGILFLLISTLFYDTKAYYLSKVCKKCGREFAYVETGETSIINRYFRIATIVSRHKCKYCGHEYEETTNIVSVSEIY
jgi:hypothetical protein